jgi:3-isopropylmalate/(R)-2-methylmalate dehydratase small subunit
VKPFTTLTAVAVPLLRANIDTDAIIPSREMRSVSKSGLADGLFAGWRYLDADSRTPNPDFVLNQPAYKGAQILLGGDNFGCGSSREHAAWALMEYGIRAVVAPSFNPIFQGNCVRNGILPILLPKAEIATLAAACATDPQMLKLSIDLRTQRLIGPRGGAHPFSIGDEAKEMLLHGLDAIDVTLRYKDMIERFIDGDKNARSWVYFKPANIKLGSLESSQVR